jgi:hypothetical protein
MMVSVDLYSFVQRHLRLAQESGTIRYQFGIRQGLLVHVATTL